MLSGFKIDFPQDENPIKFVFSHCKLNADGNSFGGLIDLSHHGGGCAALPLLEMMKR